MSALLALFAMLQAVGAIVGAGGSIFAEIFYVRALQDGTVDDGERAHLRVVAQGLRWGMLFVLIGSIGLVLTNYIFDAPVQSAATSAYWVEMFLVGMIISFSSAFAHARVTFALRSAAIFSAWWLLALLVFGRAPLSGFGATVALFVVTTAIMYGILAHARILTAKPTL